MAVDAADIDLIAARHADAYKEAELQILGIVKAALEQGIDAPTWTEDRLTAVRALRRAAEGVITRLASGDPAIRADVAAAYRNGRGGALLDLPGDVGDAARAARKVVPQAAAMDSLARALIRDIGERRHNVLRNVEDIYRQTQAAAVARMLAGGITRREASQAAWQGFVDAGITNFVDKAGRTWRLTTYVEMAVRTVSMRAAVQGQVDQLVDMGHNLVIVSDEAGECVRCRPWEGKILRIGGEPGARRTIAESVTELADNDQQVMTSVAATRDIYGKLVQVEVAGSLAEAMLAGLLHPNCGHALRAYLPGATRPPTRDTADPEHDKARQRQRAIEREIRRHKERAEAALTPEAKRAAEVKVRQWQETMRTHLAANPKLKRLPYREQIGAGNLPPGGGKAPSPAGRLTGPPPPKGPAKKATPKKASAKKKAAGTTPGIAGTTKVDVYDRDNPHPGITDEQYAAIIRYSGGSNAINRPLRAGDVPPDAEVIDQVMTASRTTEAVEVYRGLQTGRGVFGDRLASGNDLTGFSWTEDAYSSTSAEESAAAEFARGKFGSTPGVILRITVPEGTGGIDLRGALMERELLLERGLMFRVTGEGTPRRFPNGTARVLNVEVVRAPAEDRAAIRAVARDRQAEIDRRAPIGELLAEMDELLSKGADRATFVQRLDFAKTTGVDKAAVTSLRRALGDETKLRAAMGRIERKHGLTPVGRAGEVVRYDEDQHEALGDEPAAGDTVEVVRRGTVLTLNGERIPLERARITTALAQPDHRDTFGGDAATGDNALQAPLLSLVRSDPTSDRIWTSLGVYSKQVLGGYRDAAYQPFNRLLRAGGHNADTDTIDRAMAVSELRHDVVVYRGIGRLSQLFGDDVPEDLTGHEFVDLAYGSTSAEAETLHGAGGFAGELLMRLHVPAGTHAVQLSDATAEGHRESEILLDRGLRHRIVADHGVVDGKRRLDVEVLPSPTASVTDDPDAGTLMHEPTTAKPVPTNVPLDPDDDTTAQEAVPVHWDVGAHRVTGGRDLLPPADTKAIDDALTQWVFDKEPGANGENNAEPRVNAAIRGSVDMTPERAHTIAAIDQALDLSLTTRDSIVYRGFTSGAWLMPEDWQDRDLTGLEWDNAAFTSVAESRDTAEAYTGLPEHGAFAVRIHLPAGTRALAIVTEDEDDPDREGEIVIGRNLRWRVIQDNGIQGDYGIRWLDVEVTPIPESELPDIPKASLSEAPEAVLAIPNDGLDDLYDHQLRSLASEFEIANARGLAREDLVAELRSVGAIAPVIRNALSDAESDALRTRQQVLVGQRRAAIIARYQPDLTGLEDLAELVVDAFPDADREQFEGGAIGAVERITTPAGQTVFGKVSGPWADRSGETITDAEQLTALVGHALGAPIPRVVRANEDEIFTDWVEGEPGQTYFANEVTAELDRPPDTPFLQSVVESGPGRRLGLLDVVVQNPDRHQLNWKVTEQGKLGGFDHGNSWWHPETDGTDDEFAQRAAQDLIGVFVRGSGNRWFDDNELTATGIARVVDTEVWTPGDVAEVRRRLEALRPDFVRLGHEDWLDYSLRVVDLLAPHAKGTRSIFDD